VLDLSVGPGVRDGDIPNVYPSILIVFAEMVVVEVRTQVFDDAVR
jgi:hypothetical protein